MNDKVTRRHFLKQGAIALTTLALLGCDAAGGAAQPKQAGKPPKGQEEDTMPHVSVKLYPGRSEAQKQQLAAAITRDVVAILGCGEESVSVAIEEVASSDWAAKVYRPEIVGKSGTLYKKPGYSM